MFVSYAWVLFVVLCCSIVGGWVVVIFVLSVMRVVGTWRCSFMGSVCVSSCRCCVFVSVVHPVAILSAVFCVICSLLMFVSHAIGDHVAETYSSMGLVMAVYVARIVSFCFPYVVDVSALGICIVLRAFCCCDFYLFGVCEFGV